MNSANEEWRPIPGFEGRYSASNLGRVRVEVGQRAPLVLADFQQKGKKYRRVNLYTDARKMVQRGVHQLVMAAFYGPPPEGHVINHKDADPTNNRLDNMEYVTPKGNAEHASRMGLLVSHPGEANPMSKLKDDMVADIKYLIEGGFSDQQLSEMYHVTKAAILLIRRGKTWKHVPAYKPDPRWVAQQDDPI